MPLPILLPVFEVLAWPATPQQLSTSADAGLLVIGIHTAAGNDRTAARQQIRQALCECLSVLLTRPVLPVELQSVAGQPVRLRGSHIGLSISHAAGLSIAAINLHGAVGVDIQQVLAPADFFSDWAEVAADYLAPDSGLQLQQASATERPNLFAAAWSRNEAELKCCGFALTEWRQTAHLRQLPFHRWTLRLPSGLSGMLGTLVTLPAD